MAHPDGVTTKNLIIYFPSRSGARNLENDPAQKKPELFRTLCSCNADVLFVRPVFKGFSGDAYINDDYAQLQCLIHDLRKEGAYDRIATLGYCFGCGPALWLYKRDIVPLSL